ncbi:hypothetical protein BGZ80_001807 [Entomortierella chlamydospora]|uniref:Afadin and alpha-actinin-binding-domain-containing protein n=1 Tax=Entomortierella chlamydospora TaxID=101097 RepID=A0A9P6MQM3_9FUNG|nr:hypothetical protein BGZ80_001807 [Entomortierella chlamydospora]
MNGAAFKSNSRPPIIADSSLDSDINEWQEDSDLDQDESYYVPSTPFAQKLNGLDPSLYLGSGEDYCTEDNFEQTSTFVNHQLSIYGFPANLKFLKADKQSAAKIVTALYKILQQHLSTTKAQLEKAERESDALSGRISALEEELRAEGEKHRHTREELKSAKANLQYTKTLYTHEARKKEQEMNVIKEKLQKSINRSQGSSPTIPGGIKILNPVPRSLYGKQHTNETEQLLKEVIEQQQAKEAEIVEENEQLRRTLYTVHVELEGLVKKHSNLKSSPTTPYGLPFEMVKDRIETEIRDTLTILSDQWNHRPAVEPVISPSELVVRDQRINELQKGIEKLQLELEDSTLLVQGAQKMIDNLTNGGFLDGLEDFKVNVEGSDMTLQEINEAETKIRYQREELAKERTKFTQACLDLGKQREELEQAKADFEESKRTFRLEKVMSFLSFSPRSEKRTIDYSPPESPKSPLSPKRSSGNFSKKRVATSPLPLNTLDGRASKLRSKTTVSEVPDESRDMEDIQEIEDLHLTDQEYGVNVEEEEEEEELLRTPTRRRANFSSSMSLEELTKSNRESTVRIGALLPASEVASVPSSRTPFMSSFKRPQSTPAASQSTLVSSAKDQSFNLSSASNSSIADPQTNTPRTQDVSATATTTATKRLSASFSPSRPSSISASTSTQEFFAMLGQRSSPNRNSNPRPVSSSNGNNMTLSPSRSMPLISAAKVPSALSKAAANLAAKKSTARYPAGESLSTRSSSERLSLFSKATRTSAAESRTGTSNGGKVQLPPVTSSTSTSSLFSRKQKF